LYFIYFFSCFCLLLDDLNCIAEPISFILFPRHLGIPVHLRCPVPYIPAFSQLPVGSVLIQVGVDPLFSDLPARGFPVDLGLAGDPVETLRALTRLVLQERGPTPLAWPGLHDLYFSQQRGSAAADASKAKISKVCALANQVFAFFMKRN
jgi:hypothetical protein